MFKLNDYQDNAITALDSFFRQLRMNGLAGACQYCAPLTTPIRVAQYTLGLRYFVEGGQEKEIAFALDISSKTVENLRHTLMEKLQLFSVAALTKFAVRHGLTSNK